MMQRLAGYHIQVKNFALNFLLCINLANNRKGKDHRVQLINLRFDILVIDRIGVNLNFAEIIRIPDIIEKQAHIISRKRIQQLLQAFLHDGQL